MQPIESRSSKKNVINQKQKNHVAANVNIVLMVFFSRVNMSQYSQLRLIKDIQFNKNWLTEKWMYCAWGCCIFCLCIERQSETERRKLSVQISLHIFIGCLLRHFLYPFTWDTTVCQTHLHICELWQLQSLYCNLFISIFLVGFFSVQFGFTSATQCSAY